MNFNSSFKIGDILIENYQKPFIVAEIGLNHNKDIEIVKKLIQSAKKAGACAVKFQSYITDEFIDKKCLKSKFLYDIFKQYEIDENFHRKAMEIARNEDIIFFSTPLCDSSVDMLERIGVQLFKIASGDIVNKSLIKKVSKTGLPLFLSTGAASFYEVVRTLEFLSERNIKNLCLLHCVSLYPTPIEDANIRTVEFYKNCYSFPVGFSDHTLGFVASNAAVSLGACVIEKHFTLDKSLPGPDHKMSFNPLELRQLVKSCDETWKSLGLYGKKASEKELSGHFFGRRSIQKNKKNAIPLRPDKSFENSNFLSAWD